MVSGEAVPIDFGQVDQDAPDVDIVFEIRNDGGQTLSLGAISVPDGFSVTSPPAADVPAGGSTYFTVTLDTGVVGVFSGDVSLASSDGPQSPDGLDENPFTFAITGKVRSSPGVASRFVFYNNSAWDAGGDDYAAVATDKTPLLPGRSPAPANYTNYHYGINGIMVDVYSPTGTPTGSDFSFRVNEADSPDTWAPAPVPTTDIQPGGGVDGSDRATFVWADDAIVNRWLEVTVIANANTGLVADDVFCFGNSVGDTNGDGKVDGVDYNALVSEFGLRGELGDLDADFDASGQVNLADFATVRGAAGNTVQAPIPPAAPAASSLPVTEPGVDLLAASAPYVSGDIRGACCGREMGTGSIGALSEANGADVPVPFSRRSRIRDENGDENGDRHLRLRLRSQSPFSSTPNTYSALADVYAAAAVPYRTPIASEDPRVLSDDLLTGGEGDLLADILAESLLAVPL